jgi:hypothetical protein
MADGAPSLDAVARALPEQPIEVRDIFRLTLGNTDELVFIPASTVVLEDGVRVATIAIQHVETDERYLVGWDPDALEWLGLASWSIDEFDAYEFESEIASWQRERF